MRGIRTAIDLSLMAGRLFGLEERRPGAWSRHQQGIWRHGESLRAHPFHPRLIQVSLRDRPGMLRNVECPRSVFCFPTHRAATEPGR